MLSMRPPTPLDYFAALVAEDDGFPLMEATAAVAMDAGWQGDFPGGPLAGKPASGKSFVLPGSGFVEIRDGKIVRATHYFDQLAFLTQIGAIGQ